MTQIESIPQHQREDLIKLIYLKALEEKQKEKSTDIPERSHSAQ